MRLWPKISRLLKALEMRGEIYLVSKEMIYSKKFEGTATIRKLYRMTPVAEYNRNHPDKPKKPDKELVRESITESFKDIDILLKLVEIYKAGEDSG